MNRHNQTNHTLRITQIAGKALVAILSVGIFLYGVESSRWLVRVLRGIPSFMALATIMVLGIVELAWVIIVVDRKLPANLGGTRKRLLRYLGGEAIAFAVLIFVPKLVVSLAGQAPILSLAGALETALLALCILVAVASYAVSSRKLA